MNDLADRHIGHGASIVSSAFVLLDACLCSRK
jgi:hypothetical protein